VPRDCSFSSTILEVLTNVEGWLEMDSWLGAGKMEHPDRREEPDHASVSAFGAEYLLVLFNEVLAPTLGLVGDITKNGLGAASCGPGCCRTTNCTPTRRRSN
jgi:hypothetical protein